MVKNLIRWFIVYGLSFLVANVLGLTTQGVAFLILFLIVSLWQLGALAIGIFVFGSLGGVPVQATVASLVVIFIAVLIIALELVIPFIASKLFGLDFYLIYQITTFICCFFPNNEKSK